MALPQRHDKIARRAAAASAWTHAPVAFASEPRDRSARSRPSVLPRSMT